MALQTFSVRRQQDPVLAAAKVSEIVPINWHKFPGATPAGGYPPINVPVVPYVNGVYGDQITTSTASTTQAYAPKTQAEAATMAEPDRTFSKDITRPGGALSPRDPYPTGGSPAAPAPTLASLAPNTAVAGSPSPLAVVITGTNFTQWSTVEIGGVVSPYAKYMSPTKMTVLFDPKRSIAGTLTVRVVDHSVPTSTLSFTYT